VNREIVGKVSIASRVFSLDIYIRFIIVRLAYFSDMCAIVRALVNS